jgi:hypothetical protein
MKGNPIAAARAYPNPFKDEINFELNIPARTIVDIKIIDIYGAVIDIISSQNYNPGLHKINWNVKKAGNRYLQSGIYYCKITIGTEVLVQELTLAE